MTDRRRFGMRHSVWCVNRKKWVGLCPDGLLELSSRPYPETTYADIGAANRTKNSLQSQFGHDVFIVREVK